MSGSMAKHRGVWPVSWMCDALGVSRSSNPVRFPRSRNDRSIGNEQPLAEIRRSRFVRIGPIAYGVSAQHSCCGCGAVLRLPGQFTLECEFCWTSPVAKPKTLAKSVLVGLNGVGAVSVVTLVFLTTETCD